MANEIYSDKVSVNINSSTLSSIDLLVDNGYYSNRSDFINQALRTALQQQQSTLDRIIAQKQNQRDPWFLGVYGLTQRDLEQYARENTVFPIRGYGVLVIDKACSEELVFSVVESIHVRGKVICSDAIRKHYCLK